MNFGNTLLITTLVISLMACILFVRGMFSAARITKHQKNTVILNARFFYYITSILMFFMLVALVTAFLKNDFYYEYVYKHSSRDLAFFYKIAAVWAGQEGSFLVWLFILNLLGILVIKAHDEFENLLLSVIIITQVFILISILIESPFNYVQGNVPLDGQGMNRILMNPWMIAHPPLLYIGYASATIVYAYGLAGVFLNDYNGWIKKAYPWTVFSMVMLGIGIFMGGYWSYTVLGWGGYWGWDPVENSSLVPWLVSIALLHCMLLHKRKGILAKTSTYLALAYFILVFYSTFLTRSGILTNFSVHSFSGSTGGSLLKYFIIIYIAAAIAAFLLRKKAAVRSAQVATSTSWEKYFIQGIIVLVLFSAIILLATSLPIITSFLNQPYSVKENKYNEISFFFGLAILIYMISTTTAVQKKFFTKKICIICAIAAIALGTLFNLYATKDPRAYIITMCSFYMIFYHAYELMINKTPSILYSRIAHIGVAVLIIGIVSSNFHSVSLEKKLVANNAEKIGKVFLTFNGLSDEKKSKAVFNLQTGKESKQIAMDYFIDDRTGGLFREPYISYGFFGDIYITPKDYFSGMEKATVLVLKKGEQKQLGNLNIAFIGFAVTKMTSNSPAVSIKLQINGVDIALVNYKNGKAVKFKEDIPGMGRYVALYDLDASKKIIGLYVSPGKQTVIPPDSMTVEVSFKKLIWFVWLGTVLIAFAGLLLFVRLKLANRESLRS